MKIKFAKVSFGFLKIFTLFFLINDRKYSKLIRTVFDKAALVGEIAVPCNLQSATAGMNSFHRVCDVLTDLGKRC